MPIGVRALLQSIVFTLLAPGLAIDMQAQVTAALHGEVTDPTGAVIQAATVTARSAAGQTTTVKTNKSGAYEFRGLEPGKYTVSVIAKGFAVSANDVALAAGKERQLDVRLEIEVQKQELVVDEEKARVDLRPENNASATVIKGKDLEMFSDDPDELSSDLQALAGPAAGPNGGEMYVDGFSGAPLPPKASIREVRVNQNPFSAQYDHLGYGRIEIFTKPGADKFHGQMNFIENTSALDARNPFGGPHQPAYHTQEFSGNVGGPINKKGSFFFSAGRHEIRDNTVINATVLDSNFNPIVLSEAVANPKVATDMSPRVDYQLTPNNTLSTSLYFHYNQEKNDGLGQFSLPSQGYNISYPGANVQVTDTQIVNPRAVNETRFLYARDIHLEISQNYQPTISVPGAFVGGGNTMGRRRAGINHLTQLYNLTSMTLGNHLIRFGGRLLTTNEAEISTQNFNGAFSFASLDAYQKTVQGLAQGLSTAQIRANGGGASQFSITTGKPEVAATFVSVGIYGEDDWKILPNVMLSYGLRLESQDFIHARADLAPRLGIAWAPGGGKNASPKTVLRAGFGIFYDRFFQNLAIMAQRLNGITQQQYILAADSTSGPDFFPVVPPISTLTATQFPTVRELDARIRSPYVTVEATSLERQLSKSANLTVAYVHTRGVHEFLSRNINAPLPGTYDPANKASGVRPVGGLGNIYQFQSEGRYNQNLLATNFTVRGKVLSLNGSYTLNFAKADSTGVLSFPSNQYDLAADYGRASGFFGIRHRLFFGGSINLPYRFTLNPFAIVLSGQPFNITLGQDLNGDSIFKDRPAFATAATSPANTVVTRWGTFDLNPAANEKRIPVNLGIGSTLYVLNLRLSKTIGLGARPAAAQNPGGKNGGSNSSGEQQRYNLTFSIFARNVLNHQDLAPPIGNLGSPRFGQSNSLAGGPFNTAAANRSFDLQVGFSF